MTTNNPLTYDQSEARIMEREEHRDKLARFSPTRVQESHCAWEESFLVIQLGYTLRDLIEVRDRFSDFATKDSQRAQVQALYGQAAEALGTVISAATEARRVAQEALGNKIHERAGV